METVVGVAVFAVVAFSIYQTFVALFRAVQSNRLKLTATALAEEQVEIVRNLPYANVGIVSGLPDGSIPHVQTLTRDGIDFTVTTTVRNVDDPFDGTIGGSPNDTSPADYKLVAIEISCASCRDFKPVTFTTTSSPKSLETASTNGALFVQVFDANGVPIQGADVHVVSNLTPPLTIDDVTNSAGLLQLVDVPPGNNAYKITVSKPGYSTEQTYPATVIGLGVQSSPTAQNLNAIWAVTASDVWAVGNAGAIAHWNGTSWSAVSSPTAQNLTTVSCFSATDCSAAADAGQLIHWNGTAWSNVIDTGSEAFTSIALVSATDGWAVTAGTGTPRGRIFRWNGTTWSLNIDTGSQLFSSVQCVTSTNCWAAADSGQIYRWNGTAWSQFVDLGSQTWNGIRMNSASDGWVVGNGGAIYRWNGTAWSSVASSTTQNLRAVDCTSSTSCTAVGAGGKIVSWNGTAWSPVTSPTTNQLNGVDVVSSTAGYAVGVGGTILTGVGYGGVTMGDPNNPNPSKPNATVVLQQVTQVSFAIDRLGSVNVSSVTPTCAPVPGIHFNLAGTKLIGTSPDVLKYATNQVTDGGGNLTLNDLEWDTYSLTPTDTAFNLAGSVPIDAFTLAPGGGQNLQLVISPKTDDALMVSVKDSGTKLPISNAAVRLTGPGGYDKTLTTGRGFLRQTDWSGGSGQGAIGDFLRYASDDGRIDASSTPGDLKLADTGGLYPTEGVLTSSTFDTGSSSNFYDLTFIPTDQPPLAGQNSVKFQLATNDDQATWDYLGPDGTPWTYYTATNTNISGAASGHRYLRYKAYLSTASATTTPDLSEVAFTFTSSCVPPGQVLFDGLAPGTYALTATAAGYQSHADTVNVASAWQQRDALMSP